MAFARSPLTVERWSLNGVEAMRVSGILDGSTYLTLRNAIVKAALEQPTAVVVDVDALSAPIASAWTVVTSARWLVSVWPDVPIILACDRAGIREELRRSGITRYVPVFTTVCAAAGESSPTSRRLDRRRARAELPAMPSNVAVARTLVTQWLMAWSRDDLISAAAVATTVLMENAISHQGASVALRAEAHDGTLTIAVQDDSPLTPARRERDVHAGAVTSLDYLNVVCRRWGYLPTGTGKVGWALIG